MSHNDQTHFKNLAANAMTARFLKCVWPFWDTMHERIKNKRKYIVYKTGTGKTAWEQLMIDQLCFLCHTHIYTI